MGPSGSQIPAAITGVRLRVVARLFSAKVEDGIIVPDVELPDGTTVTVVVDDVEDEYVLTAEEETALDEAIAEADRGDGVTAAELMVELRQLH